MTKYFDIFNGDADGICALIQLRLVEPLDAELITGVKRDITLLQQVTAAAGDRITVLDISLDRNREDLQRLLTAGANVLYFDHHFAGKIPVHDNLQAMIDESPSTCTSLLVDRYLKERYSLWAIAAAFGDNLVSIAQKRCSELNLNAEDIQVLRQLGELINYNGYGSHIEDLHFHPASLFHALHHFDDPREAYDSSPEVAILASGYAADMEHINALPPILATDIAAVYQLPDASWARRTVGIFANNLSQTYPERAHLILCPDGQGSLTVSLRAAKTHPHGASAFCRRYPEGGGREAAAGINRLPEVAVTELIADFERTFGSSPRKIE
ncbi:acetyltransferase [Nitrosomonas sp. Nm33]|uniref:acetyltransferase n=1 Tax=Nitrosomonas sp. Nm33 TaxID=133724 RepID=UPI000897E8F3|nr:acetyltransferase [Nitrosomonas sp. Nm33]SDY45327.1 hypothetical protein SAMN05421755_102319 [Nitrosomonas sp. Nm33]